MIQLVKKEEKTTREFVQQMMQRAGEKDKQVDAIVAEILENVRTRGDEAVREYTQKFDGHAPDNMEISQKEIARMATLCDPDFVDALERAAERYPIIPQQTKTAKLAGYSG